MAYSEIGLRENLRTIVNDFRQSSRNKVLKDKRKALEDVNLGRLVTKAEVEIIGTKLKNKSAVQIEDLTLLKLAFVQNANNIVTFLKVKGALGALVRELSSSKSNFQLVAVECCCNLALGNAKSCLLVAKAAGPYLITILSGCNYNLINASVWTLGNLVGSSEESWSVLHAQGLLGKLLKMIEDNDVKPDTQVRVEIQENSLMALVHLLRTGRTLLVPAELKSIAETVSNLENSPVKGSSISKFLLSCTETGEQELLRNKVHLKCFQFLSQTEVTEETIVYFTSSLRTLANLTADYSGICAQDIFTSWDTFKDIVQRVFSSSFPHLTVEMGWLLGNLVNHPSQEVQSSVQELNCDFQFFATQLAFSTK